MAFAITVFVEAANQKIRSPVMPQSGVLQNGDEVCNQLYLTLCADINEGPAVRRSQSNHETPLHTAFTVLCSHHEGDPLQAAVCARVLAFYFLMERTAGAALTGWVQPNPETPQLVSLHPAVIEAMAKVRLNGTVLLSARSLLELVEASAGV